MRKTLILICCLSALCSSCILFRPASQGDYVKGGSTESGHTVKEESSKTDDGYAEIVKIAEDLQGVPYRSGGTSTRGFDCSGFTSYCYAKADRSIPRTSAAQESYATAVKIKDLEAGDLVFFRSNKTGKVFHVALVVENSSDGLIVVHSTSSRGVIKENISKSSYWSKKYWTGGRVLD